MTVTFDPRKQASADLKGGRVVRDWIYVTKRPTAREIISKVAKAYGLSVEALTGPSRKRAVVEARWEAMRRLKAETKLSSPQIGALFNRDHTTVLHALGTLKHSVARDLKARAA